MTTASDLIMETQRFLYSGASEPQNKLNGSMTNSQTTLTLAYDSGPIAQGTYLSIDLEILYVWDVAGSTVTVDRGRRGSTAATHADGSVIFVDPKFSQFGIFRALNAELDALSSPDNGLFQVASFEFTYRGGVYGYDITSETAVLGALEARTDTPGPATDWPRIPLWDIYRNANTTDFPSGFAVVLKDGPFTPGRTIRIQYAKPFTQFSSSSDNVTVTGLPTTAYDIPPLGAALTLQAFREPQRNFNETEGNSRRAGEVPQGANFRAAAGFQLRYDQRVKQEARRLKSLYPKYRKVR